MATALILARVFGDSPDFWLNVQWRTDLWEGMHSPRDRKRIEHAHPLFRQLTVEENLRLAWSFGMQKTAQPAAIEHIYARFPILKEKFAVQAGYLSGGQQQMVILSCATIRDPSFLLLDEPSLGLAPIIVTQIYEFITSYARRSGTTVVIAEQMANLALKVSDRGYVLRRGKFALEGESRKLLANGVANSLSASYL